MNPRDRPLKASKSGQSQRRLSRYGCRNCKLRKVKCDEARPSCKGCRVFGVICNFLHFNVPDLQSVQEMPGSSQEPVLIPPRALISNSIWASNMVDCLNLDQHDQETFCRFRVRTVPSLGDSDFLSIYEDTILKDSFTNPALMHGLLAMAAAHDRYLGVRPAHNRSTRELAHSFQCTTSFSKSLREDIKEKQKDAIWATAVILANLAFSSINVSSYEEAWPIKPADPSDLQWLRLKISDKALWKIADPMRPNSAFRKMSTTLSDMLQIVPIRGIDGISPRLADLCGLGSMSTPETNVFFAFAHALSRLLAIPKGKATLGEVFWALNNVSKEFYLCLERKDPVALLLLYLWYTRARGCRWWIDLRIEHELPAIKEYLQRHHGDIKSIQILLLGEEF
ncbi:hypothetical protein VTL71DRAFT_15641 [Oculimacula yallundae]|uniref:Zn(2)-C6 fungal-type domain-containing protein n=1 Tax=Oculimacula yallundae TaxID=86028 RepID=A0ABR4CH66_9HELO